MSGKLLALVASIALAIGLADAAARPRPKVRPKRRPPKAKVRDNIQRHRIGSGIKDGSLTKKEAGRLIHEQKKIKSMAKDITSDGQVTGKEKAILDRAQDKANAHIAKERHDAEGEMFGSTLVADGKVYVGTRNGAFWVLAAEKEKRVIAQIELDTRMSSTPVAANGVLYVATHETLWAIEKASD